MARKKAAKDRSPKNKERIKKGYRTFSLRASEEWIAWLEEAAHHCRVSGAVFLDLGAAEKAKVAGFKKEPPPRIP